MRYGTVLYGIVSMSYSLLLLLLPAPLSRFCSAHLPLPPPLPPPPLPAPFAIAIIVVINRSVLQAASLQAEWKTSHMHGHEARNLKFKDSSCGFHKEGSAVEKGPVDVDGGGCDVHAADVADTSNSCASCDASICWGTAVAAADSADTSNSRASCDVSIAADTLNSFTSGVWLDGFVGSGSATSTTSTWSSWSRRIAFIDFVEMLRTA